MNDRHLADSYTRALARWREDGNDHDNLDVLLETENEIAHRLCLPLDHTEQGLTPWAQEQIDLFVAKNTTTVKVAIPNDTFGATDGRTATVREKFWRNGEGWYRLRDGDEFFDSPDIFWQEATP